MLEASQMDVYRHGVPGLGNQNSEALGHAVSINHSRQLSGRYWFWQKAMFVRSMKLLRCISTQCTMTSNHWRLYGAVPQDIEGSQRASACSPAYMKIAPSFSDADFRTAPVSLKVHYQHGTQQSECLACSGLMKAVGSRRLYALLTTAHALQGHQWRVMMA